MLPVLTATSRRQVVIWISASGFLLVLVGTMQIRWVGQVSQSQRTSATASVDESLDRLAGDLENKAWTLLTVFRSNAALDLASRPAYFKQAYYLWHELSRHGPAVARVLIYDLGERGAASLLEIGHEPDGFREVAWDKELARVRGYIRRHGFSLGRVVKARWTATWTFIPEATSLCRPIVSYVPSSRRILNRPAVTGYLILQLDQTYIRDRLIPLALEERFAGSSGPEAPYEVRVSLDGQGLFSYARLGSLGSRPPVPHTLAADYPLNWREGGQASARGGSPDRARSLLLSRHDVRDEVKPLGVAQRVRIQRPTSWRYNFMFAPAPDGPFWPTQGIRRTDGPPTMADVIRRQGGMPRLYLATDRKHEMTLEARRVGMPLAQAMNREYIGSLVAGMIALVLLLVATGMVAVTVSRAAQTAETKTGAAASLAHQLLTPITAILFLSQNLEHGVHRSGGDPVRYGELIHQYGQRLKVIAERAMRVSAMNSYERRYKLAMLDVSPVVGQAFADVAPIVQGAGFEAEYSCAEDLPKVRADAEALRQSVSDLLSNAIKYGQPGRWVRVEVAESGSGKRREVQIRVRDRGPGIPADEASRIFEPYYRIANETSAATPGAGLGLKLAVEMVKGMGGTLTLESEVGVGSVFTIHLPVPVQEA